MHDRPGKHFVVSVAWEFLRAISYCFFFFKCEPN